MRIDLSSLLDAPSGAELARMGELVRTRRVHEGTETICDAFEQSGAHCLFIRTASPGSASVQVSLVGDYRLRSCPLGGWLLVPHGTNDLLWIPRLPTLRTRDELGRIVTEADAPLHDLDVTPEGMTATFSLPDLQAFECVVWRFKGSTAAWLHELDTALTLELQPYFTYASHTVTRSPADFYLHLVHGHVYGNHWAWPRKRKICDELDAYALHLVAAGLGRATGKALYTLLRKQIVASVMCRQEADGGFRHGEWTGLFETHNRLVNGAIHLLAAEAQLGPDPAVLNALREAAGYIARQADQTEKGAWFLHDSLESSEQAIRHYPFGTVQSTWLGKSPANLLILNTHMDCTVALDRYREVTGDDRYAPLVDSARDATRAVLDARPADWLYRPLMRLVGLTLLPQREQAALSLPLRMLKRLTWQYLTPNWHRIKAIYPRFMMPGGFVDRGLGQHGYAHRYQSVHVMDLARHRRRFPADGLDEELDEAIRFTVKSRVAKYWKETPDSRDSLGFWIEGLQLAYADAPDEAQIARLGEAALDMIDAGIGLPPGILGCNAEMTEPGWQVPCPSPEDPRIRLISLARQDRWACVAVNPTGEALPLSFQGGVPENTVWHTSTGSNSATIPARSWAWALHP